jgi:hypothetical protein
MANIGSWLKRMIDAFLNAGPKDEEERKRAMAAILQQRERREKIHKRFQQQQTHRPFRGPRHR